MSTAQETELEASELNQPKVKKTTTRKRTKKVVEASAHAEAGSTKAKTEASSQQATTDQTTAEPATTSEQAPSELAPKVAKKRAPRKATKATSSTKAPLDTSSEGSNSAEAHARTASTSETTAAQAATESTPDSISSDDIPTVASRKTATRKSTTRQTTDSKTKTTSKRVKASAKSKATVEQAPAHEDNAVVAEPSQPSDLAPAASTHAEESPGSCDPTASELAAQPVDSSTKQLGDSPTSTMTQTTHNQTAQVGAEELKAKQDSNPQQAQTEVAKGEQTQYRLGDFNSRVQDILNYLSQTPAQEPQDPMAKHLVAQLRQVLKAAPKTAEEQLEHLKTYLQSQGYSANALDFLRKSFLGMTKTEYQATYGSILDSQAPLISTPNLTVVDGVLLANGNPVTPDSACLYPSGQILRLDQELVTAMTPPEGFTAKQLSKLLQRFILVTGSYDTVKRKTDKGQQPWLPTDQQKRQANYLLSPSICKQLDADFPDTAPSYSPNSHTTNLQLATGETICVLSDNYAEVHSPESKHYLGRNYSLAFPARNTYPEMLWRVRAEYPRFNLEVALHELAQHASEVDYFQGKQRSTAKKDLCAKYGLPEHWFTNAKVNLTEACWEVKLIKTDNNSKLLIDRILNHRAEISPIQADIERAELRILLELKRAQSRQMQMPQPLTHLIPGPVNK